MFKPMLAPHEDPLSYPEYFVKLRYPLLVSPKFDGIRCIIKNLTAMSRTFKPIPSQQVQEEFTLFEHFDGELIEGRPTDFGVYNRTQSYVMSEEKPGDLSFHVFDFTHPAWLNESFIERLNHADNLIEEFGENSQIEIVQHILVDNYDELLNCEENYLNAGFEGVIMRDPYGKYKNGRGTFKEGLIYKLKRFKDAEGEIVDFKEGEINNNIQERDELGYSKRATFKAGMISANTLGNFVVNYEGQFIDVAPGAFNHQERKLIWDYQSAYIGKVLKFRYFAHGVKDKPRFPRAIGWRDKIDIGE